MMIFNDSLSIDILFYKKYIRPAVWLYFLLTVAWLIILKQDNFSWWLGFDLYVNWGLKLIFLLWLIIAKIWQQQDNSATMRLGLILSLSLGLWSALLRLFLSFNFFAILNLFTEPILTLLATVIFLFLATKILLLTKLALPA